jgi:hypothetical protein
MISLAAIDIKGPQGIANYPVRRAITEYKGSSTGSRLYIGKLINAWGME